MTETKKRVKGSTVYSNDGFKTTHYKYGQYLGSSEFTWKDNFLWTHNDDGTVTIAKDGVEFTKRLCGRGAMENMTNSYAEHKNVNEALNAFKTVRDALYRRDITRASKEDNEEVDLFAITLQTVMFQSLLKDFKITPKECQALIKSADVAAREIAQREIAKQKNLDAAAIRKMWEDEVNRQLAEIPGQG